MNRNSMGERYVPLESANNLYKNGDYTEALKVALSAIGGSDPGVALLLAAKSLLALRNFDGLGRVLNVSQQNGVAPEQALFRITHDCLMDGLYEPLVALDALIPSISPLHPIALYHASCAQLMLGDEEKAIQGFNRFRLEMPQFLNALPLGTDDGFNLIFRQGTLVLPHDETAERIAQGSVMPPSQSNISLVRSERTQSERPIVLCCADSRYIEYFFPRWVQSLIPFGCPIHVHVINPTSDTFQFINQHACILDVEDRLSVSSSSDTFSSATSYACARFEVIPELLRLLAKPIIALDIDVAVTELFARVLEFELKGEFACFETGRCEPASIHQASIMMFHPGESSVDFVRSLAEFCRPKLHQPVRVNWMLDQAALFSVIRLYRENKSNFRYLALDQELGDTMTSFVVGLASDEEKHSIKVKSAGLTEGASATGIIDFKWEP